jgi:hypothetical protein
MLFFVTSIFKIKNKNKEWHFLDISIYKLIFLINVLSKLIRHFTFKKNIFKTNTG